MAKIIDFKKAGTDLDRDDPLLEFFDELENIAEFHLKHISKGQYGTRADWFIKTGIIMLAEGYEEARYFIDSDVE